MGVAYGIEDESENDRYITVAERALKGMAMGAKPGGFFVEFLPFRMFSHYWFAGQILMHFILASKAYAVGSLFGVTFRR